jgi:LPXTG-motif cell wall-anchored protein
MTGPRWGVMAVAAVLAVGTAHAQSKNLLSKGTLIKGDKVQNPGRMTDGTVPSDGDVWNSEFTAILGVGGVAEWDLGSVQTISAARISADNNEAYFIDVSEDGQTYVPLWRAEDVEGAGMRTRQIAPIEARARYVRLHAEGGDEAYSVGELELYASAADLDVAAPKRAAPKPPDPAQTGGGSSTTWLMLVGGAVLVFLFLRRKAPEGQGAAVVGSEPPKQDEPPKKD